MMNLPGRTKKDEIFLSMGKNKTRRVSAIGNTPKHSTNGVVVQNACTLFTMRKIQSGLVFIVAFIIRLANALTVATFFQPDEFYQCLEPAYNVAFKSGYITWEWKEGLRSAIHPLLYACGYKMVLWCNLGDKYILLTPKIIGALIGAIAELYLYKFTQSLTRNERVAKICLVLSWLSPFNWFFLTRSFSNSFEMMLTTIAFSYWPWDNTLDVSRITSTLTVAIIACIIRPTNALIWMYLGIRLLIVNYMKNSIEVRKLMKLFLRLVLVITVLFLINTLVDYAFYKRLTFPYYNFVKFNIVKNVAVFYGVAPWHFYLLQALPFILMSFLPLWIYYLVRNPKSVLVQLITFTGFFFSAIKHKEIRFIYPLQPVLLVMVSLGANQTLFYWSKHRKYILLALVTINIITAYFLVRVNESGVMKTMDYIRSNEVESFGILAPCHSTPWQSHIINNQKASKSWFITCTPPLHLDSTDEQQIRSYKDEADLFYENTTLFLDLNFPPLKERTYNALQYRFNWPTHVIVFEPLEKDMNNYFADSEYHICKRIFNSYFHWDSHRQGDIIIYCRPNPNSQQKSKTLS